MVTSEETLSEAIMRKEQRIELSSDLCSAVEKIKNLSTAVWSSVAAALVSSLAGGRDIMMLGMAVGSLELLANCGGVGGEVFVPLGANGTMCAFRLLNAAQTMDVLTNLRESYDLRGDTLVSRKTT